MCLILNSNSPERKATEDIICYKVIEKVNNKFISPFMHTQVIIGATYVSSIEISSEDDSIKCILKALHSYLYFEQAYVLKETLGVIFDSFIVKCKIPVGSIYYVFDDKIASNRLQYLEIIK